MNKQELIEKYKNKYPVISMDVKEFRYFIELWEDMKQLDEPQKQVVPQFVADFITEQKKLSHTLSYSIDACMSDGVAEWYWDNSELFVRAWLDGYTVEKEKRYLVKMKGVDSRTNYLYYGVGSKTWLFKTKLIDGNFRKSHTRKELEQDNFGWVFDCPGVEIEVLERWNGIS